MSVVLMFMVLKSCYLAKCCLMTFLTEAIKGSNWHSVVKCNIIIGQQYSRPWVLTTKLFCKYSSHPWNITNFLTAINSYNLIANNKKKKNSYNILLLYYILKT